MRIHYLQHVPFEGLGALATLFDQRGDSISCTQLFANDSLPPLKDFDVLIIMGGPMSISDEALYPWISAEKAFVRQVLIETQKPVLGICLGAQFIAHCLGASVHPNTHREIGWYPVSLSPALLKSQWRKISTTPDIPVFHWHGDTFDIPKNALPFGASTACMNQGFMVDDRIIGLQFHLETTPESAKALVENCSDELDGSDYVQDAEQILAETRFYKPMFEGLNQLIHLWLGQPNQAPPLP